MSFSEPQRHPQPGPGPGPDRDLGPGPPGFEEFYRQHAPMVRKYLLWREAECSILDDAVQQTMVKAFRYWERVGAMDDPKGWLFMVAGQQLYDARQSYRRHGVPTDAATLRSRLVQPDPILAADQRMEILPAIRKLPARQQEALVLRCQFGLAYKEIAPIMGVSPATARAHVHQAKRTLTEILADTQEGTA